MLLLTLHIILRDKELIGNDLKKLWKVIKPYLDIRLLLTYGVIWFIASGWSWVFSIIGKGWVRAIAITWLSVLWLPCCPEKLITIPLAIKLYKKLFNKTNPQLEKMLQKEKRE